LIPIVSWVGVHSILTENRPELDQNKIELQVGGHSIPNVSLCVVHLKESMMADDHLGGVTISQRVFRRNLTVNVRRVLRVTRKAMEQRRYSVCAVQPEREATVIRNESTFS